MGFLEWTETKTSHLTVEDLALIKWSCIAGGVLASRLVPSLQRIDTKLLAAFSLGLAVKPAVTAFRTKAPDRASRG